MLRKKLKATSGNAIGKYDFKLRGLDNTRIEALSDGVFAIAIALLLISASVPEKFSELVAFIEDFIPFSVTIVLLSVIWYQHYIFFVRYGLKDAQTVAINTALLIFILYYVYPLKFLFKTLYLLFSGIFTRNQELIEFLFTEMIHPEDGNDLMVIYGTGAMGIFLTLALLYYTALKRKEILELTKTEIYDTKSSIYQNLLMALVPLISILIAAFKLGGVHSFSFSGFFYMTYPIIMPLWGIKREKKRKKLISMLDGDHEETA